MTRRMSVIVANTPSTDAESGQIMRKVKACRRLSVHIERLSFNTIVGTNLSSTTWDLSHNATNGTRKDTMAKGKYVFILRQVSCSNFSAKVSFLYLVTQQIQPNSHNLQLRSEE